MLTRALRAVATTLVPLEVRRWLRAQQRRYRLQWTPAGTVDFGHLRRLAPLSSAFGFDRGTPVDRYYIERFLSASSADIRGHVLEMMDDAYTRTFGGARVTKSDILHSVAGNPRATIVADLSHDNAIPNNVFDCIVCTQTLQFIYDARSALRTLHRILKPGGVLLLTAHGTSRIARREGVDPWGEYWRFTAQAMRRLIAETFPGARVTVDAHGNVLAAVASLHGLAAEELSHAELDHRDPNYEVLLTVRAEKAS